MGLFFSPRLRVRLSASRLRRTGSKSTNQLWNSARAIASSVAFIRRFNSILPSFFELRNGNVWIAAVGGWRRPVVAVNHRHTSFPERCFLPPRSCGRVLGIYEHPFAGDFLDEPGVVRTFGAHHIKIVDDGGLCW